MAEPAEPSPSHCRVVTRLLTIGQALGTQMLTAEQVRASRAILRLEQSELAEMAGVSVETIRRIEGQTGPVGATPETIDAVQNALGRKGIWFIHESPEGGPGVRLAADKKQYLREQLRRELLAALDVHMIKVTAALEDQQQVNPKAFDEDWVVQTWRNFVVHGFVDSPTFFEYVREAIGASENKLDGPPVLAAAIEDRAPRRKSSVRLEQDKTKSLQERLVSELASSFAEVLEIRLKKQPKFFFGHPVEIIANILTAEAGKIIRRCLLDEIPEAHQAVTALARGRTSPGG
jgi:transcriptional regulator with XRE-family HTH domain